MNIRQLRARLDRLEMVVTYTKEELQSFCTQLYALSVTKNTEHGLNKKEQAEFARLEVICRGLNIYRQLDHRLGGYIEGTTYVNPYYERAFRPKQEKRES
jgi:hypothetical protein